MTMGDRDGSGPSGSGGMHGLNGGVPGMGRNAGKTGLNIFPFTAVERSNAGGTENSNPNLGKSLNRITVRPWKSPIVCFE